MLLKIAHTDYPPADKPLLVWDGECPFCAFWVVRLEKITGDKISYAPFQSAADRFPDLSKNQFRQAVALIDMDGTVYSGAEAAFRSLEIGNCLEFLEAVYKRSSTFRQTTEWLYERVANNRPAMYKVTTALFGRDPHRLKPYWALYAAGIGGVVWLTRRIINKKS